MASILVLELHHPTMIMLWGHGDRSKRNKEKKVIDFYIFPTDSKILFYNGFIGSYILNTDTT